MRTPAKSGLSKPKMPVAKFELPVAKYFYRLPPGGVLMVQILFTRGYLVHSLHTRIGIAQAKSFSKTIISIPKCISISNINEIW